MYNTTHMQKKTNSHIILIEERDELIVNADDGVL
jgi:hypothetical protein